MMVCDLEAGELIGMRVAALSENMKNSNEHLSLKADLMAHMWNCKQAREGGAD